MAEYYVIELSPDRLDAQASAEPGICVLSCTAPVSWDDGEIRIEGPCGSTGGQAVYAHGAYGAVEPARWAVYRVAEGGGRRVQAVGAVPERPLPALPPDAESDPWAGVIEVYRLWPTGTG